MITKHFLKTVILFLGMIIIGLAFVFVSSYLEKGGEDINNAEIVK